jgi:GNAT superfamily N-acetyltransferase
MMIRQLTPEDAERYMRIRREALEREPFSFGSSPDEDVTKTRDFTAAMLGDPRQAVFGVFDPELVGCVGVRGLSKRKERHKGEIWGMYLDHDHRGYGLAGQLLETAIQFARSLPDVRFVHLSVTERAVAGGKLYEKLGFVTWGTEPAALSIDGVDIAERHMILMV